MSARLDNGELSIEVDSLGAEPRSIRDASGREYLWQGSAASWQGRSPLLFPVIGGLPDGRYSLDGRVYEMPSHGFARRREWVLLEADDETLRFRLENDAETLALYPFEFRFDLSYALAGTRLTVGYEIENRGDAAMLFSVGGHPGFNCPLEEGLAFSDYRLRFERPETTVRHLKEEQLLSGRTEAFELPDGILPLKHELFERGAIILRGPSSSSITLERTYGRGPALRVEFDGFPDLGIWSYPPHPAPFVCIEPWFGVDSTAGDTGDLRTKSGMVALAAGALFEAAYTIEILP